jgi:hypothetical protein
MTRKPFQKDQMTTLVVWQVVALLIKDVSGEYYNKNQSHLIIVFLSKIDK